MGVKLLLCRSSSLVGFLIVTFACFLNNKADVALRRVCLRGMILALEVDAVALFNWWTSFSLSLCGFDFQKALFTVESLLKILSSELGYSGGERSVAM